MASTNKTTNYELSQYVGSDKPTYLGDYNSDMLKIDTQMKANSTAAATADSKAVTAGENASTALTNASTAQNTADTANTTANSALSKATANETKVSALETANTYSATETLVGKWFGKPLYRKVLEITNLTYSTVTNYSHGIANVDFIRCVEAHMVNTNQSQSRAINYFNNWSSNLVQVNPTSFSYYCNQPDFDTIYGIVEYTKTTDVAS